MSKFSDETISDYVLGHLEQHDIVLIENALMRDKKLAEKIDYLKSSLDLFSKIDEIKVPKASVQMDRNFYQMLEDEKSSFHKNKNTLFNKFINLFQHKRIKSFAYAMSFLVAGLYIGHLYTFKQNNINNNLISPYQKPALQNDKMYEMAVTSMLQLPSVSMRLQAVNLVDNSQQVEETVISALLFTLNNDTNINVRLSVLSVLAKFSNTASVRKGLVSAILEQESPIIQMEIAKLMVSLQETKAIEPLKELLKTRSLINPVKETINQTINELI